VSLDNRIVEHVAATTGIDIVIVRDVLAAVSKHPDYEVVRVADRPRMLRCVACKERFDAEHVDRDSRLCERCGAQAASTTPDDRDPSTSIRAVSGGGIETSRRRH
jgi:hypothetical protein